MTPNWIAVAHQTLIFPQIAQIMTTFVHAKISDVANLFMSLLGSLPRLPLAENGTCRKQAFLTVSPGMGVLCGAKSPTLPLGSGIEYPTPSQLRVTYSIRRPSRL
jgi:hypothetical protein